MEALPAHASHNDVRCQLCRHLVEGAAFGGRLPCGALRQYGPRIYRVYPATAFSVISSVARVSGKIYHSLLGLSHTKAVIFHTLICIRQTPVFRGYKISRDIYLRPNLIGYWNIQLQATPDVKGLRQTRARFRAPDTVFAEIHCSVPRHLGNGTLRH